MNAQREERMRPREYVGKVKGSKLRPTDGALMKEIHKANDLKGHVSGTSTGAHSRRTTRGVETGGNPSQDGLRKKV